MTKQEQEKLVSLPFRDFLEIIDGDVDKANTKEEFQIIIEKLEVYKENFTSDNEIFKQSTIDSIDELINDINNLKF